MLSKNPSFCIRGSSPPSCDGSASTRAIVVLVAEVPMPPPGRGRGLRPAWAGSMTSFQISAGISPPVTLLVGELSSLPTQTPAMSSLV